MTQSMHVLIVDDEPYNRDELKYLLNSYTEIQSIDEAGTGEEALMKTMRSHPDVIFLDIEMPKMNGMEVAKSIQNLKKPPLVVFATAYPEFAAEAFRYEAVDYLLKPYDDNQLKETIERLQKKTHITEVMPAEKKMGKLAVEMDGEIYYLEPGDILYIERVEKQTKLVTKQSVYYSKLPLKSLETRLVAYDFFRIHKSFLVNLTHVQRLSPWFNGAYHLELEGTEEKLSVSRNYIKDLRKKLEV